MSDTTAIEDIPVVQPVVEEPVETAEDVVEEILGEPEAPAEETGPPVEEPSVEEPSANEPPVEEQEATAEGSKVPAEWPIAPADEPEAPFDGPQALADIPEAPVGEAAATVEEPSASDPAAGLVSSQPEAAAPSIDPSSAEIAEAMAAQDPVAVVLLETEQAIERGIAAPEAPSATMSEPLSDRKVSTADVPTGPVEHVKQAAEDSKEKTKTIGDDVIAATIPGPTPPPVTAPGAPPGAPSLISKRSRKLGNVKAAVGRKVMPKVIGLGAPKEAVPLVQALRDRKKKGEDVGKLVTVLLGALGP